MKIFSYLIIIGFLSIGITAYVWSISRLPTGLEMYVFDTKGKPSIFIRTPNDARILIDGGANAGIIRYITQVLPFYSKRIDTIIVTSDTANNATGLIDIISRYQVGRIVIPKITARQLDIGSSTDQIFENFFDKVHQLKIPAQEVERGDELDLNRNDFTTENTRSNKLKLEVLFPVSSTSEFKYSRASAPGLVMRISYGDTHFLLLGDASLKVQKFIINSTSTLCSDVLIVPHNVSATSLSADLISAVKPESIIYAQMISNSVKVDPLYMILDSNRFNLKQKSTIEVLSDGKSVKII